MTLVIAFVARGSDAGGSVIVGVVILLLGEGLIVWGESKPESLLERLVASF